ncbi:MAG: type II methionyl aminopeptidase [Candidatus Verstraetearchaeota archaeon]|jgi:methionyl aminopeptidase|nr:type II methionyl aminopeptidase [Candidatus Verstraetearchaeota archaeon]
MFTEEEIDCIIKAGKIVRNLLNRVRSFVKENMSLLELSEKIENEIRKLNGEPAFPCNIGIDEVAAHYTPSVNDNKKLAYGCLLKIDIGAHINGFIADAAITISLGSEYEEMIEVAKEALDKALSSISIGEKISNIGEIIEKTIKSYGYKPISNLTGHKISRYIIHAGVSIPNISGNAYGRIEPWSLYAIEPFVTLSEAKGEVVNGPLGNILQIIKIKGPKDSKLKEFFDLLFKKYKTLPFARRWIENQEYLDILKKDKLIYEYPVLIEASGFPVAQAEHTILTTDKEVIVIT